MSAEEIPSTTGGLHVSLVCMEEVDLLPCGRSGQLHLDGTEHGLVVIICGLPCSGKSTHAQALERRGYTRLSIDEVVWARIGRDAADLDPAEYEQLKSAIEQELREELIRLMEAKLPVVIDYSFWSRATRDRYKAVIESHGCRWELIRLKADLETLRRRLADRNQRNEREQRHRL